MTRKEVTKLMNQWQAGVKALMKLDPHMASAIMLLMERDNILIKRWEEARKAKRQAKKQAAEVSKHFLKGIKKEPWMEGGLQS